MMQTPLDIQDCDGRTVVQDLRFHVQYVLPETSEYVEELVTHPSSMVVSAVEGLIQERDMFTSNLNI